MSAVPAHERSLAARIAAEESWANTTDRASRTAPARDALWQKFLDQVDRDPVRARHLWRAHFQRLALKSAQVRRARRADDLDRPPPITDLVPSEGGDGDD